MNVEEVVAMRKRLSRMFGLFPTVVTLSLLGLIADQALASEALPGPAAAQSSSSAAGSVVESFHAALLECMEGSDELGFAGRYQLIVENQDDTFDMPDIAQMSILRFWKRLGTEDRDRWVVLSRQYWASKYAHEYGSFSGQRFETLRVEPAAMNEGVVVHTRLTQPGNDDVELVYRVRQLDGIWRIVDTHIKAQFGDIWRLREYQYGVLERGSFESLVTAINQKIEEFERN